MRDIKDLCAIVEDEIGKIAEKGLNTANLETAYKLIDMYKDIKNTEYWDKKAEYYMSVLSEMDSGYSENAYSRDEGYSRRRGRNSDGRYSSADGRMIPPMLGEASIMLGGITAEMMAEMRIQSIWIISSLIVPGSLKNVNAKCWQL